MTIDWEGIAEFLELREEGFHAQDKDGWVYDGYDSSSRKLEFSKMPENPTDPNSESEEFLTFKPGSENKSIIFLYDGPRKIGGRPNRSSGLVKVNLT
jgi:hypothetical protein